MTFHEWLRTHEAFWHGWPTRTLLCEEYAIDRLQPFLRRIGPVAAMEWFGRNVKYIDSVTKIVTIVRELPNLEDLWHEIASEIADYRLIQRRAYVKSQAMYGQPTA